MWLGGAVFPSFRRLYQTPNHVMEVQMIQPIFTGILQAEAVAASTAYVLVDLSDTTNFPHDQTGYIEFLGMVINTEKASDGVYDLWFGVISEVDATNGSADWFQVIHLEAVGNATDSTDRFAWQIDYTLAGGNPRGVVCDVISEATPHLVTNITQNGNTNWQTDTGLASPAGAAAGATGKPGAGDIVMWVEEVSGTGTIDFCITFFYRAVA